MQNTLLFLFLFSAYFSFAQQKKVLYLNENNRPISEQEYRKGEHDHGPFLHIQHETDSSLEFRIVRRENRGKLSREQLRLIRTGLETSAQVSIDSSQTLVIDYYPGKDNCNSSPSQTPTYLLKYFRAYVKELYGIAPLQQFNIYSDSLGLSKYYGVVPWYADVNDNIKNTFFPYHYPCGSFVVIHPSGFYHSYRGEYSTMQIFEAVRAEDGKDRGVLHPDSLQLLRSDLEAASQEKIDPQQYLVIRYYPGKDDCNAGGDVSASDIKKFHKEYLKKLRAIAPVHHVAVYNSAEGIDRFSHGLNWYPDLRHRVRDTFFPKHHPCFSTVLIAPDGRYQALYGNPSMQMVWWELRELAGNVEK